MRALLAPCAAVTMLLGAPARRARSRREGARLPRATRSTTAPASRRSSSSAPRTTSASTRPTTPREINAANLRELPRGRLPQHAPADLLTPRRRPRSRRYVARRRRLPRHRQRPPRASPARVLRRADRRPAQPTDSPTAVDEQIVAVGDRVHPSTREPPARARTAPTSGTQWITRPTGRSTPSPATTRPTPRPATAPTSATPTSRSPGAATSRSGRSFYTGMGRTAGAYGEAQLHDHLLGAIAVVRRPDPRRLQGDDQRQLLGPPDRQAGPTSGRPDEQRRVARPGRRRRTAGSSTSAAATAAPTRSAARCSACASLARILDHSEPERRPRLRHVHIWDPEQANGTLNSGVTRAGTLAVYGDGGTGGERTNETTTRSSTACSASPSRAGLHADRAHLPAVLPDLQPGHQAARASPIERRISKMSRPRISRFTIDLETKQLDLDSEVRIFEYDAQIYSCCHVGGGMGFDSEGNLYVTTGDTNSSQGTERLLGQQPDGEVPDRPGPSPRARTAARRRTPTRTRAAPRATPTTTTARCCGSSRSTSPDGRAAAGRAPARPTRCRPTTRRTGRTCSTAPRAAAARPSPRSTPWACATRPAWRSTRRRTSRTPRGSAPTPARRA